MIANYLVLVKSIHLIKIQHAFLVLTMCSLIDFVCSVMIAFSSIFNYSPNYIVIKFILPVSIILFFLFFSWYTKSTSYKLQAKIFLYIMLLLCGISVILYGMWIYENSLVAFNRLRLVYVHYELVRLIFVYKLKSTT